MYNYFYTRSLELLRAFRLEFCNICDDTEVKYPHSKEPTHFINLIVQNKELCIHIHLQIDTKVNPGYTSAGRYTYLPPILAELISY